MKLDAHLPLHDSSVDLDMSIGPRNLLLRGCTLRNTRCIVGCCVYTGRDTKVMKKAGGARSKMSQVERTVNQCIRVVFLTQFALCTISTICVGVWDAHFDGQMPYLHLSETTRLLPDWLANWLTFLILCVTHTHTHNQAHLAPHPLPLLTRMRLLGCRYNNFIPISLYVTMEMVNYVQAYFIDNDECMYDPESGKRCIMAPALQVLFAQL